MKIIILGAPGAGKGTQADLINKLLAIEHISTGEIVRKELLKQNESINKINDYIKNGLLLPDDIILNLIGNYLKNKKNFLLDGFPRTLDQAIFLLKANVNINCIININTEENIIIKRLKYRLINTNKNYNILFKKPKIKNNDDKTGEKLKKRSDDVLLPIQKRLNMYIKNNTVILDFYKKNNIPILNINGNETIKTISYKINLFIKNHEKNF